MLIDNFKQANYICVRGGDSDVTCCVEVTRNVRFSVYNTAPLFNEKLQCKCFMDDAFCNTGCFSATNEDIVCNSVTGTQNVKVQSDVMEL